MKIFVLCAISILVFVGVPLCYLLIKSDKQRDIVKLIAKIAGAIGIIIFAIMVLGFINAFVRLNF